MHIRVFLLTPVVTAPTSGMHVANDEEDAITCIIVIIIIILSSGFFCVTQSNQKQKGFLTPCSFRVGRSIWKERNARTFGGPSLLPMQLLSKITEEARESTLARRVHEAKRVAGAAVAVSSFAS